MSVDPAPLRVMVTSMGSAAGQGLARALVMDGRFWVLGVDAATQHGGLGLAHAEAVVPWGSSEGYVDRVSELLEREAVDVAVPVMEPELEAFSQNEERWLQQGLPALWPSHRVLQCTLSKRRLTEELRALGVPVGREVSLQPGALPLFLKPDRGTGSRGARRCERPTELPEDAAGWFGCEILTGAEYSVDGFAWPEGELIRAVCRRRDEVRGGLAVRSTLVRGEWVEEAVRRAVRGLGLRGLFNLQFIDDAERGPVFTDLNPRPGGAMSFSFSCGLDVADYLLHVARGHALPPKQPVPVGAQLFRRFQDVVVLPDEV